MMTIDELRQTLKTLETQAARIRESGEILFDVRVDASRPGGTASKTARIQHRLRWTDPATGKARARYLKAEDVEGVKEAIARGKQLKRVEKAIAGVQKQIQKVEAIAVKLGLKLPG